MDQSHTGETTGPDPQQKTILVVEDEQPMLEAIYDKFTRLGFRVLKASNGMDGLDYAESERPDLIILDVIMPNKDGISMMKEARTKDGIDSVPIIILSNLNPNDEVMSWVNRCQPAYYMIKSETKLEDLSKKVKEILQMP